MEGSRQVTFKTLCLVSFSASVGESSEQTIFTVHNTHKHTHTHYCRLSLLLRHSPSISDGRIFKVVKYLPGCCLTFAFCCLLVLSQHCFKCVQSFFYYYYLEKQQKCNCIKTVFSANALVGGWSVFSHPASSLLICKQPWTLAFVPAGSVPQTADTSKEVGNT